MRIRETVLDEQLERRLKEPKVLARKQKKLAARRSPTIKSRGSLFYNLVGRGEEKKSYSRRGRSLGGFLRGGRNIWGESVVNQTGQKLLL